MSDVRVLRALQSTLRQTINTSLLSSFLITIIFLGCVTNSRPNDCFEFGTWKCVEFHQKLNPEERKSENGKKLRSEICAQTAVRCEDEKGDHPFPLKLKMAEQGYTDLALDANNGLISGIFHIAGTDKSLKDNVEVTLATGQKIRDCENSNLESCEKLVETSNFFPNFDHFFRSVPKDVSDRARKLVCKSKDYKCISLDHTRPYETPAGWTVVINSTKSSINEGKRSESRELILKKKIR